jgi:hypothetical protein
LFDGREDGAVTGHPEERKALGDAAQHGGIVAAVKPAVVEQAGGAFAGELRAVTCGAEVGDDGLGRAWGGFGGGYGGGKGENEGEGAGQHFGKGYRAAVVR